MRGTRYINAALRRATGHEIAKAGTADARQRLKTKLQEARDRTAKADKAARECSQRLATAEKDLAALRRKVAATKRDLASEQKARRADGKRLTQEVKRQRALNRAVPLPRHYDDTARDIITEVKKHTISSHDKLFALILATRHVVDEAVPGDVVDCAVWGTGSLQAIARTLSSLHDEGRQLHRFQGIDKPAVDGGALLEVHDHPGPLEETLPNEAPERVAILRLDLDNYESMRLALESLFPRVSPGGVVLIDDYGWWDGARKAVDQYFEEADDRFFLMPVGSGRLVVKA